MQPASSVRGRDWHVPVGEDYPTKENLAALRCPFEWSLGLITNIPAKQMTNVIFCNSGKNIDLQKKAPWTGHFTLYDNFWCTVANTFDVWFKIRKRGNTWEAYKVAHTVMLLTDLPMDGINMGALIASGEEIPTWVPSQAPTPTDNPIKEECPQPSSQMIHGWPPPHGTGDDLSRLANLASDPIDDKLIQLEGIPPDRFKGDRAKTQQFLIQFKQFIMMNQQSAIA